MGRRCSCPFLGTPTGVGPRLVLTCGSQPTALCGVHAQALPRQSWLARLGPHQIRPPIFPGASAPALPPLCLPHTPPHPGIPGPSLRARWKGGQRGCHLVPSGRPASPHCPETQFRGRLHPGLVGCRWGSKQWRAGGPGGQRGRDSLLRVLGGLSRQSWGDRAEGVSREAGCLQVPASWGHVWRDRLSQALASSHTALPACLVWATNSLLFFFYDDSFENLISKGNCVNVNHDCEAQACVSTHASPIMGCSKNTPRAHCTGTGL